MVSHIGAAAHNISTSSFYVFSIFIKFPFTFIISLLGLDSKMNISI